jgi:hypothetical protein
MGKALLAFGIVLVAFIAWIYSFVGSIVELQSQRLQQAPTLSLNAQNVPVMVLDQPKVVVVDKNGNIINPWHGTLRHLPPLRYQGNNTVRVSFGTVDKCGGINVAGCVRFGFGGEKIMHLPQPCLQSREGDFASLVCHELGHVNGWGANHHD